MEEQGGTLAIEQFCVDLSRYDRQVDPELAAGRYVVISVTDTGTGIDEDMLEKIYDPYFTTKEVGKGSGMGLSVVLGLVKSHNGVIRVKSRKNIGTTFTIYLPRLAHAALKHPSQPPSLVEGDEHILVVDDEKTLVDILERSIRKLGYRVTATSNSPHALELFREAPENFDLVITDQSMPRLSGEVLCKNIKEIRPDVPTSCAPATAPGSMPTRPQPWGSAVFCSSRSPESSWPPPFVRASTKPSPKTFDINRHPA